MPYALQGIRVADFTTMIAGPFATRLLADLGAEVIKIEPLDGEPWRSLAGNFLVANRGKKDIAVDVRRSKGVAIVHRLVAKSDIFVENARVGVLKKLGLDYESLREIRPDLIYVSILGHGSTGPYATWPAYDPLFQARAGQMSAQGGRGEMPIWHKIAVNDYGAPILAAYGLMLALIHRQRTGEGQHVETSLTNAAIALQSGQFVDYEGMSRNEQGATELRGLGALHRLYETADDWIFVLCVREEEWPALCGALGREELATTPCFADDEARRQHDAELVAILSEVFAKETTETWLNRLRIAVVPAAPQRTIAQLLNDPHVLQNQVLVDHDHPRYGRVRQSGIIPRFSQTPGRVQRPAPMLGQHDDEVLSELGYSKEEIASLRTEKVIA